jgi:hypothetical protein
LETKQNVLMLLLLLHHITGNVFLDISYHTGKV